MQSHMQHQLSDNVPPRMEGSVVFDRGEMKEITVGRVDFVAGLSILLTVARAGVFDF